MTHRNVQVMLTLRLPGGDEHTVGTQVEALDDIVEIEVRNNLLRRFLGMIRELRLVEVA